VILAAGDIACWEPGGCNSAKIAEMMTKRLNDDVKAILALGDLQYDHGMLCEFDNGFEATRGQPSLAPLIRPIPGNHDYDTRNAAGYFDYFTQPKYATIRAGGRDREKGYYSFDLGTWHIIALNSGNCDGTRGGPTCDSSSAQLEWFVEDLQRNDKPCILAYDHHPPQNGQDALIGALTAAQADLFLYGHTHSYCAVRKHKGNLHRIQVGLAGSTRWAC